VVFPDFMVSLRCFCLKNGLWGVFSSRPAELPFMSVGSDQEKKHLHTGCGNDTIQGGKRKGFTGHRRRGMFIDDPSMTTLRHVHLLPSEIERRNSPRYDLPLEVCTNKEMDFHEKHCDTSSGGTRFVSSLTFQVNDYVLLHFVTSADVPSSLKTTFALLGQIRWVQTLNERQNLYGVAFRFFEDPYFNQQRTRFESFLRTQVNEPVHV